MSAYEVGSRTISRPGSKALSRPGSKVALSRPGSKVSRPGSRALMNAGGQVATKERPSSKASSRPLSRTGQPLSRVGSRATPRQQPEPIRLPSRGGTMSPNTFEKTITERSAIEALKVYQNEEPQYEPFMPDWKGQQEEYDGEVDGMRPACTFANTGVGIGDWVDFKNQPGTKLKNRHTLPLEGNWHNHRTRHENFALYSYQPKYDELPYLSYED